MNISLVAVLTLVALLLGVLLILIGIWDLIRKRDWKIVLIGAIITSLGALGIWIAASASAAVYNFESGDESRSIGFPRKNWKTAEQERADQPATPTCVEFPVIIPPPTPRTKILPR